MNVIFKKMNFKKQRSIVVLNAPQSFQPNMVEMTDLTDVITSINDVESTEFILVFVTQQAEIDSQAPIFAKKIKEDGAIWFAFPKGTSKKYKCDFNRDTGWEILGKLGFEPVRLVAIDEDWSALRFRHVDYIKTMTRSFAMTEKGKEKVEKNTDL